MPLITRREFLWDALVGSAGLALASLLPSCSSKANDDPIPLEVIVGRNVQAVSTDPRDYQSINWAMMPGGTSESVDGLYNYYMKVTPKKGIIANNALSTVITSGDLALFMISIYETVPADAVAFHVETGAYTDYLTFYNQSYAQKPMDVYFSFNDDDKRFNYHAVLPSFDELKKGSVRLHLDKCPLRGLKDYRSADRGFFIPGKIPPIVRIQGEEKTLYTVHRKK